MVLRCPAGVGPRTRGHARYTRVVNQVPRAALPRMAHVPAPISIRIRPRALRAVAWDGRPLGRVCEILRCRGSGRAWAIVRTGRLRRRRAVPMAGARYEAALVRLPIPADLVSSAPPLVRRDGRLDDRNLRRHYGPFERDVPRSS